MLTSTESSTTTIRHAINNAIGSITRPDQPDFTMPIGPDSKSALIEVGILETDDQDYVIHAMPARDRYLKMIDPQRGDSRRRPPGTQLS